MTKHGWIFIFLLSRISAINFPPMNLYIGTDGDGYGDGSLPLAVQSPYGALRLGPDTSDTLDLPIIFDHFGGYHYSDKYINVFSHTHMVGAGVQDYGEVGIFPIQVEDDAHLRRMIERRFNYRSEFTHQNEHAEPGYYQVYLDTHKVNAELTATEQVGVHRYSFDKFKNRHRVILIDSSYTLAFKACNQTSVNISSSNHEITGSVRFDGAFSSKYGGITTYFAITFNSNWADFGVWENGNLAPGQKSVDGCSSGAYVILPADQDQVTIYVGISFISIEQARINLQMQTQLQPFDSIRQLVQQRWLNEISRFEVSAAWNPDAEIIFNSAVAHSLCSPTQWDESNGVYLGVDGQVHTKPDYMEHIYTDLSIWDIFRTQIPFIIFHDSQRANDIAHSIMLIVEQGGDLPKWPFANIYTGCMIGSHADIILSDLIMKHENNSHLNMTQVIEALRKVANQEQRHDSRFDPQTYIKYHYVPYDKDSKSASLTLSYAYDDWAIGNIMHAAGLVDEAQEYYNRSLWFENIFENKTKFFCARDSTGEFSCPNAIERLDPFDNRYTEGDAWHYRFFVPHNTKRLIELFGSEEMFVNELDTFFTRSQDDTSTILPNPYYWAGNEHNLFSVWQFHYANRSDLTQKHARWLLDHVYTTKPDGIPGNDDYGTMSAWYILASIGLYPLAGSSTYLLGSPAFDRITIRRNNGQCNLTILAHNNSIENIYVQRVLLNGQVLPTFPFIDHIDHLQCSPPSSSVQLEFFMSSSV